MGQKRYLFFVLVVLCSVSVHAARYNQNTGYTSEDFTLISSRNDMHYRNALTEGVSTPTFDSLVDMEDYVAISEGQFYFDAVQSIGGPVCWEDTERVIGCNLGLWFSHQKSMFGYSFLYVTKGINVDLEDWCYIEDPNPGSPNSADDGCWSTVALYRIREAQRPISIPSTLIGPLEPVENSLIHVYSGYVTNTQSLDWGWNSEISTSVDITPGAYLVLFQAAGQHASDGTGDYGAIARVLVDEDDQDHYFTTGSYDEDWWQGGVVDLDDEEDLCTSYYGPNGYSENIVDNHCCGDDGPEDFTATTEDGLSCTPNGWLNGLEDYCAGLISEQAGSSVFRSELGTTAADIDTLDNGLDGCCGDDTAEAYCTGEELSISACSAINYWGAGWTDACTALGCELNYEMGDTTCSHLSEHVCEADYIDELCYLHTVEGLSYCDNTICEDSYHHSNQYNCEADGCHWDGWGGGHCEPYEYSTQEICESHASHGYEWVEVILTWCRQVPGRSCATNPGSLLCEVSCEGDLEAESCSSVPVNSCTLAGCTLAGGGADTDVGFIMAQDQGPHYSQFLCYNDYDQQGEKSIDNVPSGTESWNWWDASAQSSLFTIHTTPYAQAISNGQEWYSCNAYNDPRAQGISVADHETFPLPEAAGNDYCPNIPEQFDVSETGMSNILFDYRCIGGHVSLTWIQDRVNELKQYDLDTFATLDANEIVGCCYIPSNDVYLYGPQNGLNLFRYQLSTDDCPDISRCLARDGTPLIPTDPQGNPQNPPDDSDPTDTEEDIIKNEFQAHSMWGYTTSATCSVYAYTNNEGTAQVCTGTDVCLPRSGGYQITADGEHCCIRGTCVDEDQVTCRDVAAGSPYIILGDQTTITCTGASYENLNGLGVDETCCIGTWRVDTDMLLQTTTGNETFLCYQGPQHTGTWAECCSEEKCYNYQSVLEGAETPFDQGNLFGTGTELNTIASFDILNREDGLYQGVIDKIREYTIDGDHKEDTLNLSRIRIEEPYRSLSERTTAGQATYTTLTFDLYWTGKYRPKTLVLSYKELQGPETYHAELSLTEASLIEGMPELVWNRMTLNIPAEATMVNGMYLTLEKQTDQAVPTYVYVDNFVRHKDSWEETIGGETIIHGANDYCSGPYGKWLPSLDTSTLAPSDYAPVQVACEAQMSYGWTGTRCCGYQSEKSAQGEYDRGEYYADSQAGCWGGVKIANDMSVSHAYHQITRDPDILYYNEEESQGTYYQCGADEDHTIEDINGEELTVQAAGTFSFIGSWYCDPGNEQVSPRWKLLSELPRTRMMMTKLYDLSNTDDYVIHCDESGKAEDINPSVNSAQGTEGGAQPSQAQAVCVLNNRDGKETDSVTIGVVLAQGTLVNDYIRDTLRSFYPLSTEQYESIDCTQTETGEAMPEKLEDPEKFFTKCAQNPDTQGVVYYNKPLNLLLYSTEDIEGGFWENMWQAILSFFDSLFNQQESSMPIITTDLLFNADFDHAYLQVKGDKVIKGSIERTGLSAGSTYPYQDQNYPRTLKVEYNNFSSSVESLLDFVKTSGFDQRQAYYCADNTAQVIYAQLEPGVTYDWRYLTSNLRLVGGGTPTMFSSEDNNPSCYLHNGVIDNDNEECDDTYTDWHQIVALSQGAGSSVACSDYSEDFANTPYTITNCIDGRLDASSCYGGGYALFFTKNSYRGNLMARGGPDQICREEAQESVWASVAQYAKALISYELVDDDYEAKDVIDHDAQVRVGINGQGSPVTMLFGELFEPGVSFAGIDFVGPNGQEISSLETRNVWTGSKADGEVLFTGNVARDCEGWTSSTGGTFGGYGFMAADTFWRIHYYGDYRACNTPKKLYCLVPISS